MIRDDEQTGERIELLLVEPSPGDTRLFTESFKEGNLANNLHTVTDAEAALDFLLQRDEYAGRPRPDLVLIEPQLPGKSGVDLLSALNDEPTLAEIPVVVLTSSDAGEDIVKSHGPDADHYIRKPVAPGEFVEFVQSVEDFWLTIVQQSPADD